MNRTKIDYGFAAFGLTIVIGCVALFIIFTFDPQDRTMFWLGEGGVVGALVGGGTLIGVYLAGAAAIEANRHNKLAEAATRFQKGAELISSTSSASRFAGGALLRAVAEEYDAAYLAPVVHVLQHYIEDSSDKLIETVKAAGTRGEWPSVDMAAQNALITLGPLFGKGRAMNLPQMKSDKCIINRFYLADINTMKSTYKNIHIAHGFFSKAKFRHCTFENVTIEAQLIDEILFEKCEFRDVTLSFWTRNGTLMKGDGRIAFSETVIAERSSINGVAISDW